MTAATPAATAAATPAAAPFYDPVNSVNSPAGPPAQETWPGAVSPAPYGPGSGPPQAGAAAGPPYVPPPPQDFATQVPHSPSGGGWQDTAWLTGHDGPQATWDSAAGQPFAPSGALPPVLHGEDTGGVWNREHVTPAAIGQLTRHTMTGQTTVRNGSGNQLTKDNQTSPNGRADLDQQQWHNPDGHDPWTIPYSERAVLNNLAYEAVPVSSTASPYTPSGALPDRSPYDYAAAAYEAPPDPVVSAVPTAQQQASSGIGGEWVLQ